MRACDAASELALLESLLSRLQRALVQGTVLMEAKSGYGLSLEGECKLMRVLLSAQQLHPMELVVNYCGAHSIPQGSTASKAASSIVQEHIPEIVKRKAKGEFNPELIDVFCEKGVFELDDTKAILQAGKAAGLHINFHGQFSS